MEQPPPVKKEVNNFNIKPNLNSELLFFKNEILGELRMLENKLLKKLELKTDTSHKKMVQLETNFDTLNKKIFSMSNFYSENTTMKDKLENLFKAKTSIEETIYTHEYKLSSIAKDLVTAINKYDKIIEKSILYPGLIGNSNSKFNTFHNFIDYVMMNISQLNHFKDKTMGLDLKQYKNKLESTIDGFKKQTEEIITNNKVYTSKLIKTLENKFRNDFELYDQKLFNLKIKNTEQVMGLEKLTSKLINDLESITDMKNKIEKSYETSIQILRWHYIYTENRMNQCVKDYDDIKKRMDLIIEALKGFKGGNNPNLPEILKELSNLEDNVKERSKKIKAESLLKKYIVGEMNMEQISQLSKKSSSKLASNEGKNIIKNVFEDNNNSNSNYSKNSRFGKINTRSVIRYNSNKIIFNKDINSESKTNNTNIFTSQRISFPKRSQEFIGKLSNSINIKTLKPNNSDVNDKRLSLTKMSSTFFNERKLSRLNDQKIELSPSSQLLEIKSNKNIFDEKMPLDNDIQQKSSLLNKPQKNNIYNNKIVHPIRESESEYRNEFNKQERDNEESDIKEENKEKTIKKEKKDEKNTNLIQPKEKENNTKDKKENKNVKKVENINLNNNINEKEEKNKDINELSITPRVNDTQKEISDFDHQTILSTISENNVITPRGEEDKEKSEKEINRQLEENKNIKNKRLKNFKNNSEIKELKEEKDLLEKRKKNKINGRNYEDKENNIKFNYTNNEYNIKNEDFSNIRNVHLPSDKTFQETNKDNNYHLEMENKSPERNSQENSPDTFNINSESKLVLHKLLKGDRNALNSFKIKKNVDDIKMPKIPSSEYERRKKNDRSSGGNITSTKSRTTKDIKSATSINFYNSNNIPLNNDNKFDIIENLFENNLEEFFNDFIGNTDVNNINPLLPITQQINLDKQSKLNIVHIPGIVNSQRNIKNEYSNDALKRISALRKIKYENDLNDNNRNRINRSNENLRQRNQFGKLKMNNKLMRTYEGFNF